MKAFGSLAELSLQDEEAIRKVKGMDRASAAAVWAHLHTKEAAAMVAAADSRPAEGADGGGAEDGEVN
jgi:flagellar motility protein MotE (MotC chaperone)